jgi:hypothetical protein
MTNSIVQLTNPLGKSSEPPAFAGEIRARVPREEIP